MGSGRIDDFDPGVVGAIVAIGFAAVTIVSALSVTILLSRLIRFVVNAVFGS